jgi:CheY-like chemotaxis protein
MDKMTEDAALKEIEHHLDKDVLKATERSLAAMEDFRLSSRISAALAQEGHHVGVSVSSGVATLTTNRPVLLLERLEAELKRITEKLEGVRSVSFRVEKAQAEMDFYRKFDPASPSKILLVDDEREFAQSLSERLIMREMGSVVAYDGASALSMVEAEEPEVMILDLRMPGIDGIEVLKRIKKERPDIEVIILTGHGTEADRMLCMGLGAFAYLQKPVEIEFLSETLRKANEKARSKHA